MKLQGRNLSVNMRAADVGLLQSELQQLGFNISGIELKPKVFGETTRQAVLNFQKRHGLPVTGIVDPKTAEQINAALKPNPPEPAQTFKVSGQIRQADGSVFVNGFVKAFDKDLRSEELLGTATLDQAGRYQIAYTSAQFVRAEKGRADLIIRVFAATGARVGSSAISFNAEPDETLDLVIGDEEYRGPSEYEQLVEELTPLVQGLSFAELTEDDQHQDVTFLSGETGQDPQRIAFLIQAHRLMQKTDVPAEVFYGLFREGLPTELPALLAQSADVRRRALGGAADDGIIPAHFGKEGDKFLERFKGLIVKHAFQPPAEEGRTSLGDLLGTTLSDVRRQEEFLTAYVNHTGPIEGFWKGLRARPEFKDQVEGLQFTLQLGALTGSHLPLAQELQRAKSAGRINTGQKEVPFTGLQDLTRLDAGDWLQITSKQVGGTAIGLPPGVPGKDDGEKRAHYATVLTHMVEDAFPTAFVARRLENDDLAGKNDLLTFFAANPGFNLRGTRLDSYLKDKPDALTNVADAEGTKRRLKAMQRLYNLAPRYEQMRALMKDGIDSAHRIARVGQNVFMARYGEALGGKAQAKRIHEKARQVEATAVNLLADHGPMNGRVQMHAVPDQVDGVPEWSTLFGSLELCGCEHCKSVYGPAAYLVDVLQFLRDRKLIDQIERYPDGTIKKVTYRQKTSDGTQVDETTKDVLFKRRPDLGEIELTCQNTNTPLPYVDLVNEVLENAVAPFPPFTPFNLPAGLEADLNSRTLSEALRATFNPPLSTEAGITVGGQGQPWTTSEPWWTIGELAFTYTIRKESGEIRVVSRSLQTKGSAAERAASPRYVNAGAYEVLRQRVYPWSLPFDLWVEEARAYLGHLGVPRYQIMETFLPGERLAILNTAAVAHEYLGLTSEEAQIITGVTTSQPGAASPGPWNLWGFAAAALSAQNSIPDPADRTRRIADGNWLDVIRGRVDVVLQQSGLKYKELLDLLDTHYLNPIADGERTIQIVSVDPGNPDTCETDKLRLDGLDEAAAAHIVRFVRLWRKLGWTMRDLDLAITTFKPADLSDGFLTQLSHVQRLHGGLNLPVSRLLSWWAPIDTAFYIDHSAPGQPRLPSLYDQLFRNRAVTNPLDPAFSEEPTGLSGKLSEHVATITVALGISADDFSLLFNDANVIPRDAADPTKPDDTLSLDYLSRLYRHATLAKALKLPVRDYLTALRLITANPFATTADTVIFVEKMGTVRHSGFTLAELDYLLRHDFTPASGVAPGEEAIALILDEIRSGLQKIAAENTLSEDPGDPSGVTTDPRGDLTRQKLALLNWDVAMIEQAIAILGDTATHEAPLDALPAGMVFPDPVKNKISYDSASQTLRFSRAMTLGEKNLLLAIPIADPLEQAGFQSAVNTLFDMPRTFISRHMRTFTVPNFAAPLATLPASVKFPSALRGKAYYDATAQELHFIRAMTELERDALLNLSTSPNSAPYQAAVTALFNQPNTLVPPAGDEFLTAAGANNDAAALFDNPTTPEARFLLVLRKLLPYLLTTLSERLVKQTIAETLKLEVKTAEELLTEWMDDFRAPSFAESHLNVRLSAVAFRDQFETFTLLHKIALVIARFRMTPKQLRWLFEYGPAVGWLDLNSLPRSPIPAAVTFDAWEKLVDLVELRDGLPLGETVLDEVFRLSRETGATQDALLEKLTTYTGWGLEDLRFLGGPQGFDLTFPDAYKDERALVRLKACFVLLKRLGMAAEPCRALAQPVVTEAAARSVQQAVRAKYEEAQWLSLAKPLRDVLRGKQRAALVAYLVTHPDEASGQSWREVNDLYAHLLIDVEMSPCFMTSRIKQAISSTQLFVQRCLMNLEPEVAASAEVDVKWREWKWMKSYRIWEANRKVFLYPENWIEPELRDDKSPFFKELESELLQSDLTLETAATAFLHYLEKLDQVARLEIVGMYHQVERDQNNNVAVDILHVFGRTYAVPHVYYYRQRVDSASWTAWERVDLDIEGDYLIPVVWNRRLYLFWPIFTEKAEPLQLTMPGEGDQIVTEPQKYWEIKIAWSERKQGKWTNKKVSSTHLEVSSLRLDGSPRGRRLGADDFLFRSEVDEQNNLHIGFEVGPGRSLRLAREGGETPVGDDLGGSISELVDIYRFRFDGCNGDPVTTQDSVVGSEPITGTAFYHMFLREAGATRRYPPALYLPAPTDTPALNLTPGTFLLLPPHEEGSRITRQPFFYLDNTRTFFVVPSEVRGKVPPREWPDGMKIDPAVMPNTLEFYYEEFKPFAMAPVGPVVNPADPMLFEPSFPLKPEFGRATTALLRSATPTSGEMALRIMRAVPRPRMARIASGSTTLPTYRTENRYLFQTFYHPYVCAFVHELNRDGIDGLLQRKVQTEPYLFLPRSPGGTAPAPLDFKLTYEPDKVSHPIVLEPYPVEDVDFEYGGAYSQYNWELFFHAPLMIADRLSKNQRFEEAQKWFHYIFDPTDTSSDPVPQRYWRTKKLYDTTREDYQKQRIQYILKLLAAGVDPQTKAQLSAEEQKDLERFEKAVAAWRRDPFKPHLIARTRTTAYQKTVVMKYIDNLIAWGDQLFRRDTIESINEATQLYVLAAEILGRQPQDVPPRAVPSVQTYNSLEPKLDTFSNALVQIEEFVSPSGENGVMYPGQQPPLTLPTMLYFCVPKNETLLRYWDTVADRLFKIRYCMNIAGVVRQLPLFEPAIEPGLLVRAAAAGVDISSALGDISAALPNYRFTAMIQKATELCNDVKALGAALLSALEKRDGEELALIRAAQETALLELVEQVKQQQYDEGVQNLAGLRKSRDVAVTRYLHYQKLLGVQSPQVPAEGQPIPEQATSQNVSIEEVAGVKMIPHEKEEIVSLRKSHEAQQIATGFDIAASLAHIVPNWNIEPWGVGATFGGSNVGSSLSAFANFFRAYSAQQTYEGTRAGRLGGYALRAHEWTLQSNLGAREIMQIDKQIVAAEIRKEIANRELENHRTQIDNARDVEAFMRDKYTNQELYAWMVSQVAGVYFQAYQLAYDVAKRAERGCSFELGLKDSSFIQFGYWDSLKRGLLAGEKLYNDLKRMEVAYLDQNKREYEITKHISLAMLDPVALLELKETGECLVDVPEALFDLDYPGHYLRRVKSVSLSIPCVTGPYTGVNCTLTLLKTTVRHTSTLHGGAYQGDTHTDDPRFTDSYGSIQSIVTSSGQNDSGLFETNLRDERYLPFEGAGAISQWRLELAKDFRPFDYDTISDVILHMRYTARDGGDTLKQAAVKNLKEAMNTMALAESRTGLLRLFSAKHEFPSEWHRFLHPAVGTSQPLGLDLTKERFPFQFRGSNMEIAAAMLFAKLKNDFTYKDATPLEIDLKADTRVLAAHARFTIAGSPVVGLAHAPAFDGATESLRKWTIEVTAVGSAGKAGSSPPQTVPVYPDALEDIWIVCQYSAT